LGWPSGIGLGSGSMLLLKVSCSKKKNLLHKLCGNLFMMFAWSVMRCEFH